MPATPARLALQTGLLDDHRRPIEPGDKLWDRARRWYAEREDVDALHDDELRALCERWPARIPATGPVEALAVAVALASPFAGRERILAALTAGGVAPDGLGAERAHAPALVSPWAVERPPFPHIYDPDSEERAPIIAVLDGPRSAKVAELLETIKRQDRTLADAIVLGADLETLELLDRLLLEATRAARWELAAQVEQDKARWSRRAEQARARQRLEASHYGWHSDNFPPGCLEAARAAKRHEVEVLLEHPPSQPS